jgi:hypothetical protein
VRSCVCLLQGGKGGDSDGESSDEDSESRTSDSDRPKGEDTHESQQAPTGKGFLNT